jgi:MIP family channel proteins
MDNARNRVAKTLHTDRSWLREFFAEFLGTAFLVALGDAAVAQMLVRARTKHISPSGLESWSMGPTDFLSVNFGYAFAIAFGVYICGGVSGGHINPAVTLAMCLFGRLPWRKLPVYWAGQYFGGFVGSVLLYVTYYSSFVNHLARAPNTLGLEPGVFATYPAPHMTVFPAFLDQVMGGAILLLCVFALTDPRNAGVPKYFVPLLVGLVVGLIGMAYGIQCGYAINPARDFAPRLFSLIVYGTKVFEYGNGTNISYFFWIPIIGPHLGAILGALIYQALIGIHWPVVYEEQVVITTTTTHITEKTPKEAMSNL